MSTASHALPGKPSFGGLLARIILIVLLWAALVTGTLHYVGYIWPKEYQISQAEKEQADERAEDALKPPASPTPAAASTPATPAGSAAPSTPANVSAGAKVAFPAMASSSTAAKTAPAASGAPAPALASTSSAATTNAPAAAVPASSSAQAAPVAASTVASTPASNTSAPAAASGTQKLPFDLRLAGYNRTAFENLSIFFSIVISVFCVGTIILQVFKYKQTET